MKLLRFRVFTFLGLALLLVLTITSYSREESPKSEKKKVESSTLVVQQQTVTLPTYSVLDEDIYDTALKTQVVLNILVSGEISEPGLRALLDMLYSSIRARGGFKYYNPPTNVYIYAFTSKERAESGWLWIAMLHKSYSDVKPTININERQIAQLDAKPDERFGLSEEKRKEIWKELVLVERRARKEAEERYPLDLTQQSLRVGQVFQLSEETPLMPELEPADPMAALQRMRRLPPRTTIKVLKLAMKRQTQWYLVEAKSPSKASLGSGWINSIALIGQAQVDSMKQMEKQFELESRLKDNYKNKLAKKYGLTCEQLDEITTEAFAEDWPFPK